MRGAYDVVDLVEDGHGGTIKRVEFLVEDIKDPLLRVAGGTEAVFVSHGSDAGLEGHTPHCFTNLAKVSTREVGVTNRDPWLHAALHRYNLRFEYVTFGNRNAVELVFREEKSRTRQFSNTFSHVDPNTAESWLQILATYENQLI